MQKTAAEIGRRGESVQSKRWQPDRALNPRKERESLRESIRQLEQQQQQKELDALAYAALIRRCAAAKAYTEGKRLHTLIARQNCQDEPFLSNLLLQMYGSCGTISDARSLLDSMPVRNVHSWTMAMAANAENGYYKEALVVFRRMYQDGQKPDRVTFSVILAACAKMGALDEGREIHRYAEISGLMPNVAVGTAVVSMYGKCGRIEEARRVFDELQWKNSVTWNAMMSNYKQNSDNEQAVNLFNEMCEQKLVRPDKFTYSIAIEACSNSENLTAGAEIHQRITGTVFEQDVIIATALLNMYSKCGKLAEARKVFDVMEKRDAICWNAMIAAYAHHGQGKEAIELYKRMQETTDLAPKQGTYVSVIDVCAELSALRQGRAIHARVVSTGFDSNLLVCNALIHMYGKCGCLSEALEVFQSMKIKDEISWNTIISSYAYHGHSEEALLLYREMDLQGVRPSQVTFVSILSACNHGGLVQDGLEYFHRMREDHSLDPLESHYGCIIDLLGRGGRLADAELLMNSMPARANAVQWMSLLGACKTHGDLKRGSRVADSVADLIPETSGPYVVLSNIYAAAGRWKDVEKVRRLMAARGVKKTPGVSSIEVGETVHQFVSGDVSHPQLEEIYLELHRLLEEMKTIGYVPDTTSVLHDVQEEEKEEMLSWHSEKLAIVYGHMATPARSTLRIVKNLRVCSDCHTATKFISRITQREIIVRDAARFHHFTDGRCSCNDYW